MGNIHNTELRLWLYEKWGEEEFDGWTEAMSDFP